MAHLLWPWYICLLLSLFLWAKKKIILGFYAASPFPFLSQLLFHEIWLLVFCFFSISFSAQPKRCLLSCQPSLSAQHNVPKISTYREAILKLHSIKFAILFQNRRNKLCFFTEIQHMLICLCSRSLSVCLFTPLRVFVFEHLFWTGSMSLTDYLGVPDSPSIISFSQR